MSLEEVGQFDLVIRASDNRVILVEVTASPQLPMSRSSVLFNKAHFYRLAFSDRKIGLLLVSRYPPSAGVQAMFNLDRYATYVVVRGREDEETLINAINGLLSDLELLV